MSKTKPTLDEQIKMMRSDRLDAFELNILFEKLDLEKRYPDMLHMIIIYTPYINRHFEITSCVFNYNLEHDWDWNTYSIDKDDLEDLYKTILNGSYEGKLSKLIRSKITPQK